MHNKKWLIFLFALIWVSTYSNPFEIHFPAKQNLSNDDYIEIQNQIRQIDLLPMLRDMYRPIEEDGFMKFEEFVRRCSIGKNQVLIDPEKGLYPQKELIKIGQGGDRCVVCYASLNGRYPYYVKSLVGALQQQGFNGYCLYYLGGWPTPTGEEIKYIAVPYSFKIFAMEEAHLLGFNHVLWIDSAFLPLKNIEPLFDLIQKQGALLNWRPAPSDRWSLIFPQTRELLLQLTEIDAVQCKYSQTGIFGLKMDSPQAKQFIENYYQCLKLGTPFLSCFPEEYVFSAITGKKEFQAWTKLPPPKKLSRSAPINAEDSHTEVEIARRSGAYFYHRIRR